jgi:ribosomal protein L40E
LFSSQRFTFHGGFILELEYTDAPPVAAEPTGADTFKCPQCGHTLPGDAERCDRCGYTRLSKPETAEGKASDAVAVLLSVIPGLGHVYKGYRLLGLLFVIGAGFAILIGALAATATAGFGLGLIPIYWFAVMFHVYAIEDRIAPGTNDQGEEY